MFNATNVLIALTIVAYLAMVVYVGFKFSRQNKDTDDFFLGGRKLGPFVTAMSAEASDMSSWLLLGLPGVAYLSGLADASWTAIGLAVGTYLNWLIVSRKIRRYSVKINAITIPEFFTKRYHDAHNILQTIAAIVIVIFFIPYTGSGFAACGKLFKSLFGVDYHMAMIIAALIIAIYTTLGGFMAASTTDFIQSIVMTIALFFVVGYGITAAGGFSAVGANLSNMQGFLDINSTYNNTTALADPYGLFSKITTFCWGLGYFGMPHILLRFMAVRNASELKTSRRVASIWVVFSLGIAVVLGIVGRAMTNSGVLESLIDPENLGSASKAETLIVVLAQQISEHNFIFALIAGMIIAGILASTMSTADSQLIAASSAVSENIIQETFGIKLSEASSMLAARATLIVVAVFGIIIAWNPNSSVFNIVSFAWAGFGAVFGPAMIMSLYWKRTNRYGAIAGMIAGGLMVFIWKYLVRPLGGVWNLYELAPAFLVAIIMIVVVSLITPAPDDDIVKTFEKVQSK